MFFITLVRLAARKAWLLLTIGALLAPGAAMAHPHVWVTIKSEVVYAPDGSVTGVRHAWTFDDMFSAYATQGLDSKVKGQFTREELAPLAEVNVTSLKDFDYFTYATVDGKKTPFLDPVDYWLDYANNALTLHFTLPFKTPLAARHLELAVYDPTIFVDFELAKQDPVTLVGAPARCKLAAAQSKADAAPSSQKLGEAFFNSLTATSDYGAQFANKIVVTCR